MNDLIKIEIWRDIPGYEGLYQISNYGRVKSLPKIRGRALVGERILKWHILNEYPYVILCSNGKVKNIAIHRLVATAFIENPDNKPIINHIDGNKLNWDISNLEWSTYSENTIHAYKTGLKDPKTCARYGKRKPLTDEQKRLISIRTKQAMKRPEIKAKLTKPRTKRVTA